MDFVQLNGGIEEINFAAGVLDVRANVGYLSGDEASVDKKFFVRFTCKKNELWSFKGCDR